MNDRLEKNNDFNEHNLSDWNDKRIILLAILNPIQINVIIKLIVPAMGTITIVSIKYRLLS